MNTTNIKLLFVIPTLGHGGAQKVITELMSNLIEVKRDELNCTIHLLTFREETDPVHKTHPAVNLEHIDVIDSTSASLKKMLGAPLKIRKEVKRIKPDLIVAFQDIANFPTIIASVGLKIPVILSERNDPRHYRVAIARNIMRKLLYRRANHVVVQTEIIARQMPRSIYKRTIIIPNAVPKAPHQAMTGTPMDSSFSIISAGRLETQKDHNLLIEAFAKISSENGNWFLKIYGEGSLRQQLEEKIIELRLEAQVSIEPATNDIYDVLSKAHLFVLSSEHEGFPNILAEAVATGLPCIGFASVSGVPELIIDGKNGILLKDNQRNSQALATAMSSLIADKQAREIMSKNCRLVAKHYKSDTIYTSWINLISKTATFT